MDPQQRALLERGYEALHAAGHDRASMKNNSPCGVFLGIQANDYTDVLRASPVGATVYGVTGGFHAIASGRLSYVLGLQGPCVAYDTACSAQLVAGHGGLRAWQLNECPVALVMGVNISDAGGIRTRTPQPESHPLRHPSPNSNSHAFG